MAIQQPHERPNQSPTNELYPLIRQRMMTTMTNKQKKKMLNRMVPSKSWLRPEIIVKKIITNITAAKEKILIAKDLLRLDIVNIRIDVDELPRRRRRQPTNNENDVPVHRMIGLSIQNTFSYSNNRPNVKKNVF